MLTRRRLAKFFGFLPFGVVTAIAGGPKLDLDQEPPTPELYRPEVYEVNIENLYNTGRYDVMNYVNGQDVEPTFLPVDGVMIDKHGVVQSLIISV
jgi:hypothetical protein